MKIKDLTGKSKCDKCGEIFDDKDVVERPVGDKIFMNPGIMSFVVTNKEHTIISCSTLGDNPDDNTLHCPKCGAVHLFGFDHV